MNKAKRAVRNLGLAFAGVLLAGCYTMQPARGPVPETGTKIGLGVNDAGRVALGGQMGPEIDVLEGMLLQQDSTEYLVAVSLVHLLKGGEQKWNGEKIRVKSQYVSAVYERQFSKERSIAAGAVGLSMLYYIVAHTLHGNATLNHPDQVPDSNSTVRRRPPQIRRVGAP